MRTTILAVSLLAPTLLPAAASAQFAVGITWPGDVVLVDLASGVSFNLGTSGLGSANAMASQDDLIYVTGRLPSQTNSVLATIDPTITASATNFVATDQVDVRALSFDDQGVLFAIANGLFGPNDGLVRIDTATGASTLVGNTTYSGIQGLEYHQGTLYGWECSAGLVRVDRVTGAATDVNAINDGTCNVQTLFSDGGGTLYAFGDALWTLDPVTSVLTAFGVDGLGDVRGGAYFDPSIIDGTPDQLSVSAGGSQTIAIQPGTNFAGMFHLLLGTLSGTTPGVSIESNVLPLNIDVYFLQTLTSPNAPPLAGSFGVLDGSGTASASFTLPPSGNPVLVGLTVNHAYVVLDLQPTLLSVPLASPALPLVLEP